MVYIMDNNFDHDEMNEAEEPTAMQKIKDWAQENLRIIVSVLIVLLIASSIYSYSKRGTEDTQVATETSDVESILSDLESDTAAPQEDSAQVADEEIAATETTPEQQPKEETKAPEPKQEVAKQEVSQSQETEKSFIEVAQRGDGTTHLARKALANYLEKNPDSSLTNEHKIYIEDYLRKNIPQKGHLAIGSSVEFSKDLIKQAIDSSKNLNAGQLKNLQKYSANVNF